MAYDFQKLADVELLEEVPDGASAFVAVDGIVKRVPGSGLGGGGIATAILRMDIESNITCDNYTYEQARAVLVAGNPLTAMILMSENNISGWGSCQGVALYDNCIAMLFNINDGLSIYWNADGFFDREPANHNP